MNMRPAQVTTPRLPVYIVIDCSGTMLHLMPVVRRSVNKIVEVLRSDLRGPDTAYISVIWFNDDAHQTPLTALRQFISPDVQALGKTQLGLALKALNTSLDRDLLPAHPGPDGQVIPGDYQPLVFLITDGSPSEPQKEDWEAQAKRLKERAHHKPLHVVALALGEDANVIVLRKIASDTVMVTGDLAQLETALAQNFDWVADTVVATFDAYTTMHGQTPNNPLPQYPQTLSRAPDGTAEDT